MSELVDGVKGLFKSDSGGQNASGKETESESAESDKGSGESAGKGQESKGSKLKEVAGQIVKGVQETFEKAKNEEKGDASLAEQMKELNEVQVDKAFVSDSINLLGTLSFDKLIGNPLRAAIKAQRDLAKETLSYIREEGMKVDEDGQGQITYVSMTFLKDGKQVRMRVAHAHASSTPLHHYYELHVQGQGGCDILGGSIGRKRWVAHQQQFRDGRQPATGSSHQACIGRCRQPEGSSRQTDRDEEDRCTSSCTSGKAHRQRTESDLRTHHDHQLFLQEGLWSHP